MNSGSGVGGAVSNDGHRQPTPAKAAAPATAEQLAQHHLNGDSA